MTIAKLGHRTYNHRHWSEVQTRGTSTGNPCSYRYTNGVLAELKIQTLYKRNTRRRTIKVYAGIATLAFAHEPSAKAKKFENDVTDTPGLEHATSRCARRARCSASPIGLRNVRIYTDLITKLLKNTNLANLQNKSLIISCILLKNTCEKHAF